MSATKQKNFFACLYQEHKNADITTVFNFQSYHSKPSLHYNQSYCFKFFDTIKILQPTCLSIYSDAENTLDENMYEADHVKSKYYCKGYKLELK